MNVPDILNVAIGLVLLFFLLSTIASLAVELVTIIARYREEILQSTVHRLLLGGPDRPWGLWNLLRERWNSRGKDQATLLANEVSGYTQDPKSQALLLRFWTHPKIRSLVSNDAQAPASLSSDTFAQVLVDIVVPKNAQGELPDNRLALERSLALPDSIAPRELRTTLKTLALTTEIAPGATGEELWKPFRANIAAWFDEASRQATELYRQKMKRLLFVTGFVLALGLNADAVRAMRVLYHDRSLREATAAYAATVVAEREAVTASADARADLVRTRQELSAHVGELRQLEAIGFPIGWTRVELREIGAHSGFRWLAEIGFKLFGLLATGLAVAQGGPFWYDLMQKLVSLRKGGGQGAERRDERPAASAGPAPEGKVVPKTPLPLEIGHDLATPALGFSARKAHWLASASAAAYSPEADVAVLVRKNWLFPDFQFFDRNGAQAFLAADEKIILLAFRGTEVTDVRDILVDVKFKLTPFADADPHEVHGGFLASFRGLEADLRVALVRRLKANPRAQLYLTGHSLGGALATVTFADLMRVRELVYDPRQHPQPGAAANATDAAASETIAIPVPTLYTFGCPQVGNDRFAAHLDQRFPERIFRVENHVDIIPELPSMPGYRHVGRRMYFNAKGEMEADPTALGRLLAEIGSAVGQERLKDAVTAKVTAHGVANYVERCERLAKAIA